MPDLNPKLALKAAIAQLENILESNNQGKGFDAVIEKNKMLLSSERIRSTLEAIQVDLNSMLHDITANRHDYKAINKIENCLTGNGCKITGIKYPIQNDDPTGVERSFTYQVVNESNTIIVNELTNTKFSDGQYNAAAKFGSGKYKTVKQSVRLMLKNHVLTKHDFKARGSVELGDLKRNGYPMDKEEYDNNLEAIKRDSKISKRYNSESIAQLDLGATYDHIVYINKETGEKVSKTSVTTEQLQQEQVIEKKTAAIYTFSEPALGSMENLDSFLNDAERKETKDDLRAGSIPKIYHNLLNEVLKGLDVIHARRDIFQDLKLENILIFRNENGELTAKITDFGLAILAEDSDKYKSDHIAGSADYSAPEVIKHFMKRVAERDESLPVPLGYLKCATEQIEDISQPQAASDIWCFGMMLVLLLKPEATFTSKNCESIKDLNALTKAHPILKALLKTKMQDRPNVKQAQQMLRLDYLLHTNEELQYDPADLEILKRHKQSLLKSASCWGFFKPKHTTPHNSLKIVTSKIKELTLADKSSPNPPRSYMSSMTLISI